MTTAEWFDYGAQALANFAAFFGIFLTLSSAYLVAAYTNAKSFSGGQIALINTSFILCSILNLMVQGQTMRNSLFAFRKASKTIEGMATIPEFFVQLFPFVAMFLCCGIVLGCLKFMWDIRHPKAE